MRGDVPLLKGKGHTPFGFETSPEAATEYSHNRND
jgi:hypothetical protein